ncbi:hypothetical protein BJ912DRAFT_1061548 [Pholiota molesta]|nr:hypothetical protein BJ912DRAFT_1061548 [Pholiota molesta]
MSSYHNRTARNDSTSPRFSHESGECRMDRPIEQDSLRRRTAGPDTSPTGWGWPADAEERATRQELPELYAPAPAFSRDYVDHYRCSRSPAQFPGIGGTQYDDESTSYEDLNTRGNDEEYHWGPTNSVDDVIHAYRPNTTLDFGAAGHGAQEPAAHYFPPLRSFTREVGRGVAFAAPPVNLSRPGTPFRPYPTENEALAHNGNNRGSGWGLTNSFDPVIQTYRPNTTDPIDEIRAPINGTSPTEPATSTASYGRELTKQNNAFDPHTRAGKRPHSDEYVVENQNPQSSSSRSSKKARNGPLTEGNQKAKTAPVQKACPLDRGGAHTDSPSTSPSSRSPSPPPSPSPPLPAFTGFVDPIVAHIREHTPPPPEGTVRSTLSLPRAYRWKVVKQEQFEDDAEQDEDDSEQDEEDGNPDVEEE